MNYFYSAFLEARILSADQSYLAGASRAKVPVFHTIPQG